MARHRLTPESRLPIGLVPGYWDLPRPYPTHEAKVVLWKTIGDQRFLQSVDHHDALWFEPCPAGDSHGR